MMKIFTLVHFTKIGQVDLGQVANLKDQQLREKIETVYSWRWMIKTIVRVSNFVVTLQHLAHFSRRRSKILKNPFLAYFFEIILKWKILAKISWRTIYIFKLDALTIVILANKAINGTIMFATLRKRNFLDMGMSKELEWGHMIMI